MHDRAVQLQLQIRHIMNNRISQILLLTAVIVTLHTASHAQPTAVKRVKAALDGQVAAWNAGDLEKAMAFYWNSPDILWISRGGVSKGYQPVFEDFKKDFADRSKMGVYTYTPLHIEMLSKSSVLYVYRWKIELNGKRIMGGVSSQIWKKIDGVWLITSEHAS
jgi:ketosteroid isomerase-like protein